MLSRYFKLFCSSVRFLQITYFFRIKCHPIGNCIILRYFRDIHGFDTSLATTNNIICIIFQLLVLLFFKCFKFQTCSINLNVKKLHTHYYITYVINLFKPYINYTLCSNEHSVCDSGCGLVNNRLIG